MAQNRESQPKGEMAIGTIDAKRIDRLITALENATVIMSRLFNAEYAKNERSHERLANIVRARKKPAGPEVEPSDDVKRQVDRALRRMDR